MNVYGLGKRQLAKGLSTAFFAVSTAFSQGPQVAANDSVYNPTDTLSVDEKLSRKSYKGRDRKRPYQAFYVTNFDTDSVLIAQNEDALIHMASFTKLPLAMAYYYCRDRAIEEAQSDEDRAEISKAFAAELPYLKEALVHSDNRQAHRIALFLEYLELNFINQGLREQKLKRGRYRAFSKVIIPEVLKSLDLKETKILNPSGLPPYEFRKYPRRERPFNYKGTGSGHYRDPDDYNVSTPREMAKILKAVIKDYPQIHSIMRIAELYNTRRGKLKPNTNTLLENSVHEKAMPAEGFDIAKTGTSIGGGSLMGGSAFRRVFTDSVRLLAVDAGYWKWARDSRRRLYKNPNREYRDLHMNKILDSAYGLLERERELQNIPIPETQGVKVDSFAFSLSVNVDGLKSVFDQKSSELPPTRRERRAIARAQNGNEKARFGFVKKLFARKPDSIELSRD